MRSRTAGMLNQAANGTYSSVLLNESDSPKAKQLKKGEKIKPITVLSGRHSYLSVGGTV